MALAVDATSSGYNAGATLTVSHTCSASASVLFAIIGTYGSYEISDVKYAGSAMTQVASRTDGTDRVFIYSIDSPASGANNIVVVYGGGGTISLSGISFTGSYSLGNTSGASWAYDSVSLSTDTMGDSGFILAGCTAENAGIAYTGSGTSVYTSGRYSQVYEAYSSSANPTQSWTYTTGNSASVYQEIYNPVTFKPIVATF